MIRRPPRSTRTDTLFPYTTLFRSTILVASQARGTKAHGSGIPFDDPSGDRLSEWMGFSKEEFYDANKVEILPIVLCYHGRAGGGGVGPPRPECERHWRERLVGRSEERRVGTGGGVTVKYQGV